MEHILRFHPPTGPAFLPLKAWQVSLISINVLITRCKTDYDASQRFRLQPGNTYPIT